MSDENYTLSVDGLIDGTVDTFVVCAGAGLVVARKTVAEVKTLLGLSGTNSGDQDLSAKVTGPASATDNAIMRFDATTGKLAKNSGVTIDDSGNLLTSGEVRGGTVRSDAFHGTSGGRHIAFGGGFIQIDKQAYVIGMMNLSSGINLAGRTKLALLATTPTASTAGIWRITDSTPAQRPAYPDGTNWRYVSDDAIVV